MGDTPPPNHLWTPTVRELLVDRIKSLVCALVDDEDKVKLHTTDSDANTTVIELKVGDNDYGKIVGKRGQHIDALCLLVSAAGRKYRRKVLFVLLERDGHSRSRHPHQSRPKSRDEYSSAWKDE
jgi:predicted RNA-binding protein YlqC (UPF0109 family)